MLTAPTGMRREGSRGRLLWRPRGLLLVLVPLAWWANSSVQVARVPEAATHTVLPATRTAMTVASADTRDDTVPPPPSSTTPSTAAPSNALAFSADRIEWTPTPTRAVVRPGGVREPLLTDDLANVLASDSATCAAEERRELDVGDAATVSAGANLDYYALCMKSRGWGGRGF